MKPPLPERSRSRRIRPAGRSVPAGMPRPFPSPRRFLRDARGGATAIVAAAVTVMTVGGTALIGDHLWLVDQRDTLKSAAEAASVAATLEIHRQLADDSSVSDADLKATLEPVAKRYVLLNLDHLAPDRLKQAKDTLKVDLQLNRKGRTVGVTATADLGGTLFSRDLPLLGGYEGPEATVAKAGVEAEAPPVEVVLAIDTSISMLKDLLAKPVSYATRDKSRIAIVKRAAKQLVAILDPDGTNRVAVGIVPWNQEVHLDSATANGWSGKGWARYPAKRTYPVPYLPDMGNPVVDTLPVSPPQPWKGCFDEHRIRSGVASLPALTETALFEPPSAAPFAQGYFTPMNGYSYRCRDASEKPAGVVNSCLEGHPDKAQVFCVGGASRSLAPLSTDRTAVDRKINGIFPTGAGTYSSLGVLWAQRMLEPDWKDVWSGGGIHPVDPETPEHTEARKAIVLLTDGEDSPTAPISSTDACTVAKSRGTEIFVIAAMHPNKVSGGLKSSLRACSSTDDSEYPRGTRRPGTTYLFINNATPETLEAAFTEIANQLRTFRRIY